MTKDTYIYIYKLVYLFDIAIVIKSEWYVHSDDKKLKLNHAKIELNFFVLFLIQFQFRFYLYFSNWSYDNYKYSNTFIFYFSQMRIKHWPVPLNEKKKLNIFYSISYLFLFLYFYCYIFHLRLIKITMNKHLVKLRTQRFSCIYNYNDFDCNKINNYLFCHFYLF